MPTKPLPARPTRRELLDLRLAAEYAGVSVWTIRRRIAEGVLPAYRFGPRLLKVDRAELDAAMLPVPTVNRTA